MGLFDIFKKKEPVRGLPEFKGFPVSNFKQYIVNPFRVENEDYELNECLEDEKIYRYDYHLLPSVSDNGNGYDVIARNTVIGKLDPDTADSFDDFIADHPDYELDLTIEGGPYKLYDSESEKIITGSDKYKVTLYVKYYVAKKK